MSTRKIQSVLYVDDDPDICEVVQATLCFIAGLNVHTAESGEQAIDLAYEWRPDLVLMDVMMPGLDGPSTLKRMREHALLADIPVIFLTAKVLPAEVAHFLQLGAIGVIGKPFDPLKLCDDVFALWKNVDAARGLEGILAGQSQVREQVGSLTDSFLQRTRRDVVRLRAIIERARHEDRSVLEEAHRIAHSIHGAGAMFGFPDVSAAAGAIERLVEGVMASTSVTGSTGEPAVIQQLLNCNEQLARELDAAGDTAPSSAGLVFRGQAAADRTESSSRLALQMPEIL
jgi:two-component system, OmpR family, response regulator